VIIVIAILLLILVLSIPAAAEMLGTLIGWLLRIAVVIVFATVALMAIGMANGRAT